MKLLNIIQIFNRNIFSFFALFLCLSLFFIGVSCTDFSDKTERTTVSNEEFPDMEIYTFFREFFVADIKQMEVFATNVKFYVGTDSIELYDTFTHMFEENVITSSVSADKIIINDKTLYTKLYTNVVLKSSNGTVLYTEYIEWDNTKRYFHTKEAVRIEQPDGSWMTGVGMEGDMNYENYVVYNEEDEGYPDSLNAANDGSRNNARNNDDTYSDGLNDDTLYDMEAINTEDMYRDTILGVDEIFE